MRNLSKITLTAIALTIASPAQMFDISQDPLGYCLNETKQAKALVNMLDKLDTTIINHAKLTIELRNTKNAGIPQLNAESKLRSKLHDLGEKAHELSSNSAIACSNEFKGKYYGLIETTQRKANIATQISTWENDTWKDEALTKKEKEEEGDLHPGSELSEMADHLDQEVREEDCEKIDMAAKASKE